MSDFSQSDVEITDRDTLWSGYFRIDRYRLRHRTFSGGWTEPMTREVFERGHAVAVLPYDPVRDQVVLIEQFRCGALAAGYGDPWLIECVAGIIETGEDPLGVARRESLEESGLDPNPLLFIGDFIASPGACSETCRLYCGIVDSSAAGGLHGLAHEHEDIRVFVLRREEAYAWCRSGRINNSITVVALQWLMLEYQNLRGA